PSAVAVGDFDGDGHADLVAANATDRGTVSVLRNNGDGTYQPPQRFGAGGKDPRSVAVGDLDGDSDLDLVVANLGSGTGGVLLNRGDGTFAAAGSCPAGMGPTSVAVGDLDGDSDLDLVVANRNSNTVSVLKNQGDGTFAAATSYAVGAEPWSV